MANDKAYIGIDPGSKGFIAFQYDGEFEYMSISDSDIYQLSDFLREKREKYPRMVCVMEQIHAIFGSSAKATFSFGEIYGKLQGILATLKIPYVLIQPKEWQKEIWTNPDMVYDSKKSTIKGKDVIKKVVNTKETSTNSARRLFPSIDFRMTERAKNIDDNKVDATLICEYARRKNL